MLREKLVCCPLHEFSQQSPLRLSCSSNYLPPKATSGGAGQKRPRNFRKSPICSTWPKADDRFPHVTGERSAVSEVISRSDQWKTTNWLDSCITNCCEGTIHLVINSRRLFHHHLTAALNLASKEIKLQRGPFPYYFFLAFTGLSLNFWPFLVNWIAVFEICLICFYWIFMKT